MKNRPSKHILLGLLAALVLWALSGCRLLPSSAPPQDGASATMELHLGPSPEDVVLRWDPALVKVDSAEVTVDQEGATVTVRLRPSPKKAAKSIGLGGLL